MQSKEYKMPDGRTAIFEYDICEVGKITLESMDMLMGELIAYKRCVQNKSYLDAKHCDGCRFYDDCPFNPREDEDEPQTMVYPQVDGITPSVIVKDEPKTDCDGCQHYADEHTADACYECKRSYTDGYEPQTIKVGMATDSVTGKVLGITADTDCAWGKCK